MIRAARRVCVGVGASAELIRPGPGPAVLGYRWQSTLRGRILLYSFAAFAIKLMMNPTTLELV